MPRSRPSASEKEAQAEKPEAVPDVVVAVPVVIFAATRRVWQRGGFVVLGFLILIAIGGVTDIGYLLLTGGMGGGLIVSGILAGEVAEEMRNREVWAFVVGIVISFVAVISSVLAVNVLAPDIFNPAAVEVGERDRVWRGRFGGSSRAGDAVHSGARLASASVIVGEL